MDEWNEKQHFAKHTAMPESKRYPIKNELGGVVTFEIDDEGRLHVPGIIKASEIGKSFTYGDQVEAILDKAKIREQFETEGASLTLDDQVDMHNHAVDKGFWEYPAEWKLMYNTKLMLIVSEVAEAMEELRTDDVDLEKFGDELADIVIRVFDLAEMAALDLVARVKAKHQYNLTRPHKHGGKAF